MTGKMTCDYYNAVIYVIIGLSPRQASDWLKRQTGRRFSLATDGQVNTFRHHNGADRFYLYVKKKEDIPTLVHETNHLAKKILHNRGVNDNEAEAYYQEFLFRRITGL